MEHKHKFSIIVPHYDKSVTDNIFCEGIQSLIDQSFKDFETLIYHDGPLSRPLPDIYKKLSNVKVFATKHRENNWGHGNRDRGIKQAQGEYIIHFNPDNLLFNNALEEIDNVARKNFKEYPAVVLNEKNQKVAGYYRKNLPFKDRGFRLVATNNIIVFPIYMLGHFRFGCGYYGSTRIPSIKTHKHIFTGDPVIRFNIDCMQLVMKRELWLSYDGWYDKSKESDGHMYMRFAKDHGVRYCDKILGEHR